MPQGVSIASMFVLKHAHSRALVVVVVVVVVVPIPCITHIEKQDHS